VAERLRELGAVVIDADELARRVVEPGSEGFAEVVARFGHEVVDDAGGLDRARLGQIVFADEAARRDLEAIIHPRVRAMAAKLRDAHPDRVVVEMIPLLVETGQAAGFDQVIVVDLPEQVQRERLVRRSGLTPAAAQARVRAQATREQRLAAATTVIDNSGDRAALIAQVDGWWHELQG
jgi:dephospho-CoA kinase